jgi:hypothetical protein
MSNKITLELNPNQVEELVEKLSLADKIHLVRKLENETWASKLDIVVKSIRRSVRKARISDKEIDALCEDVKREYNEKRRRH